MWKSWSQPDFSAIFLRTSFEFADSSGQSCSHSTPVSYNNPRAFSGDMLWLDYVLIQKGYSHAFSALGVLAKLQRDCPAPVSGRRVWKDSPWNSNLETILLFLTHPFLTLEVLLYLKQKRCSCLDSFHAHQQGWNGGYHAWQGAGMGWTNQAAPTESSEGM